MVTATRPTPLQVPGQSKFWTGSHSTLGRLSVSSKLRGSRLGRKGSHQPGALHCCATGTACAGCKRRVPQRHLELAAPSHAGMRHRCTEEDGEGRHSSAAVHHVHVCKA